ncbi:hypothetical protein CDAR_275551 [Caerostris darwini]|uniref:Uncharacterized protein n=1 Tax=Caerostris darwini TaxID=1538125 RepID=A0AAV4UMG2_9ARAC|nr:hypothetical protein CDAR_275551 [Caerostris darwini]
MIYQQNWNTPEELGVSNVRTEGFGNPKESLSPKGISAYPEAENSRSAANARAYLAHCVLSREFRFTAQEVDVKKKYCSLTNQKRRPRVEFRARVAALKHAGSMMVAMENSAATVMADPANVLELRF